MKKGIRKIVSAVLIMAVILSIAPLSSMAKINFSDIFSVSADAVEPSGKCGDNAYWSFDEATGVLTISGTGKMYESDTDFNSQFCNNDAIKSVVIEDGIENAALLNDLIGVTSITIPDSVEYISDSAFCGCTSLTDIVIPYSVERIGDRAFLGCSSLESVDIPDKVKCIESNTFAQCDKLKTVIIPGGVTSIEECAFNSCADLTDVIYLGKKEQWEKINIDKDNEALYSAYIRFTMDGDGDYRPQTDEYRRSMILNYEEAFSNRTIDIYTMLCLQDIPGTSLNPISGDEIVVTSHFKRIQPDKPAMLLFKKSVYDYNIDDLSFFVFDDGKLIETFSNRLTDPKHRVTEITVDGEVYYSISVSRLGRIVITDSKGDVNRDGEINSTDALNVLKYSVGIENPDGRDFSNCDVNNDGEINSSDAMSILQFSVGQIEKF